MPDNELLDTKIESLEHCVHRIESHTPSSASELEQDYDSQDIISVNLQRAIQICVDLGGYLISKRGWNTPSTMAETFQTLADNEALSGELAGNLQRAVGFRNISVHEYDKIDWHRVYHVVTDRLDLFRQFAREIVVAWPESSD
ncbi:MAG: DUF86 domain-containing protein [Alkalispirochaeta sp.]